LFSHRLRDVGLDPDLVYSLPAVGKLLAYWRVNFEKAERDGRAHFGDRFVSQNFEQFCEDPGAAAERIYQRLGLSMPEFDFSRIHPANRPFDEQSPNWEKYSRLVGIDESLWRPVGAPDTGSR
jgi:hypothetical protein